MTVGIAAMCQWVLADNDPGMPVVVGASDRMLTSGDVEFEPPQPKIFPLTNSIVMLIAGDTAALTEVRHGTNIDIGLLLAGNQRWLWVQEIAEVVSRQIGWQFKRQAERVVLRQFGLDMDTFIKRQNEMQRGFVDDVLSRMERLRPNIETIVAGVDPVGAHIYHVDAFGTITCHDAAGFAAIGIGSRHAESQFMFARHAMRKPLPETMLLTYTAKRRAEIAPGVGLDTDMFAVAGLGGYTPIASGRVTELQQLYRRVQASQTRAQTRANQQIANTFRVELDQKAAAPTPPPIDQAAANPEAAAGGPPAAVPAVQGDNHDAAGPAAPAAQGDNQPG